MIRIAISLACMLVLLPSLAAAQAAPEPKPQASQLEGLQVKSLRELDDDSGNVQWNNLTVDQLEGMDIVNGAGEKIGEVEEVLADGGGTIVAITAEVGGFLGIGQKEVIVAMDQIKLQGDELTTALSAEQLEALPRWDDD